MNFFEHQARARRRTLVYLLFFLFAAAAVVFAVTVVTLTSLWWFAYDWHAPASLSQWVHQHPAIVVWTVVVTIVCIAGASLYRMVALAGGGGSVAQELGAVPVHGETSDIRRRRLMNVVEEMAIAAGVPVPGVYVLEEEVKINAFAAGYSPSDAAIIVTRGMLDCLTREELQAVVAHEFSHLLNGDTRLNTRLIGVLFGILFVSLAGRLILRGSAEAHGRASVAGVVIGGALAVVGLVGLMFGRLIQAAVSRSRERLADASAVQFTRNPGGLTAALKKIAVRGSTLISIKSDEVSHMLVADGRKFFDQFFATHPPIIERIRAIEPHFDAAELEQLKLPPVAAHEPAVSQKRETLVSAAPTVATIATSVGNPGPDALATAIDRRAAIPESLVSVAHSSTGSLAVLLGLVLSADASTRRRQVEGIGHRLGLDTGMTLKVEAVANQIQTLDASVLLPLSEITFPALRRRSVVELRMLSALIDELIHADGVVTVREYALARMLRLQIYDLVVPQGRRRFARSPRLRDVRGETQTLLSILAQNGKSDARAAQAAYVHAIRQLYPMDPPAYAPPQDWVRSLDHALLRLDRLAPQMKEALIEALARLVTHDQRVTTSESELLRVICAGLHCPLPPLEST